MAAPFQQSLGQFTTLSIRRFGPAGAFLGPPGAGEDAPRLLLLGPEIPEGAREGDELRVFVYLDSHDRPIATTRVPRLALGEVAFLRVTARAPFGAFVEWGLPKELLVPFSEQTTELSVGSTAAVGLYVDDTGRLAGTMRVSEMLDVRPHEFHQDDWVAGEAWRRDPELGWFVIVERAFLALLPKHEPERLTRGEQARFRISNILPDGKLELSLRGHVHEELDRDAERVLGRLQAAGAPRVGDRSSPELIRDYFGLSKKAFKRALGRLLRQGTIQLDSDGYARLLPRR